MMTSKTGSTILVLFCLFYVIDPQALAREEPSAIQQPVNASFVRVKRCRPGAVQCRTYRLWPSSGTVVHERYVSAPVVEHHHTTTEYHHHSSSGSKQEQHHERQVTEKLLRSPAKVIVEQQRVEKYRPAPIVQQKVEKIVEKYHPAPIVQQKVEKIVEHHHRPYPVVQQKIERIVQEPVVQQKVERIVQQPVVVQQKIERIVQEPVVVQQKVEHIVQKPVVVQQQKIERIVQEPVVHHHTTTTITEEEEVIHVRKKQPVVSLRVTACPEGHYLSADGTHCKHINCEHGFEFSHDQLKCVDLDECSVPTACLSDERCINTYGSYVCRKLCTQAGYRLSEVHNTCDDIDECAEGLHQCGPQQQCINTPGSYRCECPAGYRMDGQRCIDVDECLESHHHLCPNDVSICENTPGSYRCRCRRGFEEDHRGRCIDVDECQLNNGGCSQRCRNKHGSYECHCHDGFKLSSDGHTCVDVDECSLYAKSGVCSPQVSTCENTPGSYRCRCKPGFRDPDGTGRSCIDVDECQQQIDLCEQNCHNTYGSYKCSCRRGYRPVDAHRCEDIDECHEGDVINEVSFSRFRHDDHHGHPKLCQGGCENNAGSYRCTCPHGYNLVHNHHCVDIDECQEHGYCRGPNQTCVNLGGSFRCIDDRCPPGYHRDGTQCKISQRLVYSEICDDPTEVCDIDRIICYSYAYVAFRSKMVQATESSSTTEIETEAKGSGSRQVAVRGRGHEFFTFVVPIDPPIIADFSMRLVSVKSPRPGVRAATASDFEMRRTRDNEVRLAVLTPLEGPQDIELEIEAKMYKNGLRIGKNLAIVTVFISEYEF